MRLRNIPGAREELAADRFVIPEQDQPALKGHWGLAFQASSAGMAPSSAARNNTVSEDLHSRQIAQRPLHLEIGMGKGKFLTSLAERNPDINYCGIEKYSSVLVRAVRKREDLENAGSHMDNLLYLRMDAEKLPDVFAPGEVSRIYLNFSDPWPKDRHAHRRLPGRTFLERYRKVLTPDGHIEFKTDNRTLFEFAIEEAKACGWVIEACTFDLHADPRLNEGNIMTEYEERFSALGNPICKLISRPPTAE